MSIRSLIPAFLLLILIQFPVSIGGQRRAVLDADGDELQCGMDYYVVPAALGIGGGGLSLGSRNGTYPLDVMQHNRGTKQGKPVRFVPALSAREEMIRQAYSRAWPTGDGYAAQETPDRAEMIIRESKDLNIQFSNIPTVWRLGETRSSGRRYVTIGGRAGHPGRSTVDNWFKIERLGPYGYKIVHCPSVCRTCRLECQDIGTYNVGGKKWLSTSDDPMWVVFEKVERE